MVQYPNEKDFTAYVCQLSIIRNLGSYKFELVIRIQKVNNDQGYVVLTTSYQYNFLRTSPPLPITLGIVLIPRVLNKVRYNIIIYFLHFQGSVYSIIISKSILENLFTLNISPINFITTAWFGYITLHILQLSFYYLILLISTVATSPHSQWPYHFFHEGTDSEYVSHTVLVQS